MKRGKIIIGIFLVILLIGFTSAGFSDFFKKITGQASSLETAVSVNVAGAAQASILNVSEISAVTPNEAPDSTSVSFSVTMCDSDGVNDLDDSSVQANFTSAGETTRYNTSCVHLADINNTCAKYNCTIDMWYWDGVATWDIGINGTDLGNQTVVYNVSTSFSVSEVKGMLIDPGYVNWTGVNPTQTDKVSDNNITINNTGNYDGTIDQTSLDLYGLTVTTENFSVHNFVVDIDNGCDGVALVNNTAVEVTSSDSNPGNLSLEDGSGQEVLDYCIPLVPSLSSQEYTTSKQGSWIIGF